MISDIYAVDSTFTDFVYIERASQLHINILVIENSTINGFIFTVIGFFQKIHLSNLWFD